MNDPAIDPTTAVSTLRKFLFRVMNTPLASIKVTGDPATDENADLLKSYHITEENGTKTETLEKLDAIEAMRIDNILDGTTHRLPNGKPDLVRGADMFTAYVAERVKIYP